MAEQAEAVGAKATKMVRIGCRLPNGIDLEVGLQTTVKGGPHNRPVALINQLDTYKLIHIRGTRAHQAKARASGLQLPAMPYQEPFYTMVPAEFWEQWNREHGRSPLLRRGDLFEASGSKAEKVAKAMDADQKGKPALQPVDPSKPIRIDDAKIVEADFAIGRRDAETSDEGED